MRLFYYAPAVSSSYCVGIHNGHGIGSIFAKLFSKVAAKTAAKAAAKVVKSTGKKIITAATAKGAEIGKQALAVAKDKGTTVVKNLGKKAVYKLGKKTGHFINQGIDKGKEAAIKLGVDPRVAQSQTDQLKRGVNSRVKVARNAVLRRGNQAVNELVGANLEEARGKKAINSTSSNRPTSNNQPPDRVKLKRKLSTRGRPTPKKPKVNEKPRVTIESINRSIDEDE